MPLLTEPNPNTEVVRGPVRREDWAAAYAELHAMPEAELEPEDLAGLADASWWVGEQDESLAVRTRAYAALAAAGAGSRAAFQAGRLAIEHFQRGEPAVGMGWLQRARRHLEGRSEGPEHGFLAGVEATVARHGGDLDRAMTLAATTAEIGRRTGSVDVWVLGLHTMGLVHVEAGRVEEGIPLLDEAMTSVVAGQLSDYFTGVVYCNVIDACLQIADVARASQWSDAARAWCESIPDESPYPGLCRVNRAQVADLRGAWSEAHAEAERASRELLRFDPYSAGLAHYEAGEIRRRLGDVAGADEAFRRARELGFDPEPGHALLRLAEGKASGALSSLRLAAQGEGLSPLRRARVLAATVEAAIATDDPGTARSVSAELDALAEGHGTPALSAVALATAGRVALAAGGAAEALPRLRRSASIWQELRLPYEAACARALVGTALRELGNEEGADLEIRAALAAFERLGAEPDAARVRGELEPAALPRGLTAREAEVLRLVAAGKSNREIAAELVISQHTVARHLQNMFAKLDVSSRAAATAFAFEHRLA